MANLTLSIDDELLHQARRYALDRRTTLNQLVREYLAAVTSEEERRRAARERIKAAFKKGLIEIGDRKLKREDLYDRAALRRLRRY